MTGFWGVLGEGSGAFCRLLIPEDLFSAKRAASFPLLTPLNPVILNELVLSLRITGEMKDLLTYTRI
jgi:hypothetical protein